MGFTIPWVESLPDGDVMLVSDTDDELRSLKASIREREEGDPTVPFLTGIIEAGSWALAPTPKAGAGRIYYDTAANVVAFGADKRQDGRLAITTDLATPRLYHAATAGMVQIGYVNLDGNQPMTGPLTITAAAPNLSGTVQRALNVRIDSTAAGTSAIQGIQVIVQTPAAVAVTEAVSVYINCPAAGAAGTITGAYGLYISDINPIGVTTGYSARIDGAVLFRQGVSGYTMILRDPTTTPIVQRYQGNDGGVFYGETQVGPSGGGAWSAWFDVFYVRNKAGLAAVSVFNTQNVVLGRGALNTAAVDGFVWIPEMAGAASGVPVSPVGTHVPMHYDTTNNRLRIYSGGAWKSVLLS